MEAQNFKVLDGAFMTLFCNAVHFGSSLAFGAYPLDDGCLNATSVVDEFSWK